MSSKPTQIGLSANEASELMQLLNSYQSSQLTGCALTRARSFMLSTASLSALGYEDSLSRPVVRLWNETRHVEE